ncbi:MAG: Ppx/GppA family phosphatase [Alphaproteobacteria bacterium]|nr:Ppx/GppA family phosphatase [Alphaproteobacteria bacterium]
MGASRNGSARRSPDSAPLRHGGRFAAGDGPFAALDLGTNNCRLLVATVIDGDLRVLDAFSRIVRLGAGLAETGCLSEAAMDRTLDALRVCARKVRRWHVAALRCVATEACRRASNAQEFLERVERETGLALEIVSPDEEAFLALAGCAPLLEASDPAVANALVFDIGGGSTEVTWLALEAGQRPRVVDWLSMPVGVVSLAERHGGDQIPQDVYAAMVEETSDGLAGFEARHGIAGAVAEGHVQMLGSSGTVTTLAGIHLDLPRYNRAAVDGTTLERERVLEISHALADMDWAGRAAIPCVGPERADLVVAGCAILEAIQVLWPVDRLRVADRGVREGILFDLAGLSHRMPARLAPSGDGRVAPHAAE